MFYVFYSCCGSKIVTAVISVWLKEFTKHLMLAYSYVEIAEIMCVFSSSFFYLIRHFFTKISLCFVSSSGRRLPYSEKSPLLTLKKEGIFSLWRKRIFFFFLSPRERSDENQEMWICRRHWEKWSVFDSSNCSLKVNGMS